MNDDFEQALLERHPALDFEEDALLYEWLSEKHRKTLQRQGAQSTAEIARQDVEKYFRLKNAFLGELSNLDLDLGDFADQRFALKQWNHYGYSVLFTNHNVYDAVQQAEERVDAYLMGKGAAPSVADATALASRFSQENLEALVASNQKQRDFILAFSEFLSKALQLHSGVQRFRRDVLGGSQNTISHEEADDLVRSPATQLLSIDSFNEAGIHPVEHTAKLVPRKDGTHLLCVEPPGKTVTFGRGELPRQIPFRWFTKDGGLERPFVGRSSLLGRLGKLSEDLTKHHPITVEQAAYLTLCGGVIQPRSISGRIENTNYAPAGTYAYNYSTITLTVASWMSPEQVRQAYAKFRREATANNTYRSKSDKNIAVFRFVIRRAALQVPKDLVIGNRGIFKFPPWRQLVEEWNKQYPSGHRQRFDQHDRTAEKMFRNAFVDGYRAVTGLKYYAPKAISKQRG